MRDQREGRRERKLQYRWRSGNYTPKRWGLSYGTAAAATAAAKSHQSSLTLCEPIDGSPPGSPVPGILQARTLGWAAIAFSNAGKWKVKVKSLSYVWLLATPWTAAYQAPLSMGYSRQDFWSGLPWAWVNSGSWWWTGRPGMLRFIGLQRVRLNWVTELIWSLWYAFCYFLINLN